MSEILSVEDSPDTDNIESSSGGESDSAVSEVSYPAGTGNTMSSDDSGTTHPKATPDRDVDVEIDESRMALTAKII